MCRGDVERALEEVHCNMKSLNEQSAHDISHFRPLFLCPILRVIEGGIGYWHCTETISIKRYK